MYGHSNSSQVTPNSQQIKQKQVILRVAPEKKENQHTMPYTYTYKIQKRKKEKQETEKKRTFAPHQVLVRHDKS